MRKMLLCALLLAGCNDRPKAEAGAAAAAPAHIDVQIIDASLSHMGEEFDQGPVAADTKYRGNVVTFSGLFHRAEVEDDGAVYVGIRDIPHSAICAMHDTEREKVGKLIQGKIYMLRMVGVFAGFKGKVLNFIRCTLVGAEER